MDGRCDALAGGEWPQAESHFELFIRKSKGTYPIAQLRYAECLDRQGRFADALEQLTHLKNQRYALKRLNQCLGRVHWELNNHKAAQEELVVRVSCSPFASPTPFRMTAAVVVTE